MIEEVMSVYVLRLENDKWYVGSTSDMEDRLERHSTNNGSKWTKIHPMLGVAHVFEDAPHGYEGYVTLRMMKDYGIDNVRGGGWCAAGTIVIKNFDKKYNKRLKQFGPIII